LEKVKKIIDFLLKNDFYSTISLMSVFTKLKEREIQIKIKNFFNSHSINKAHNQPFIKTHNLPPLTHKPYLQNSKINLKKSSPLPLTTSTTIYSFSQTFCDLFLYDPDHFPLT